MAKFPFTVQAGDWFKTRPSSTDPHKPSPRCREILNSEVLDPDLEVRMAKRPRRSTSKDGEDIIIASLPYNHTIGPVYSVSVRQHLRSWQMLVEVPSIANEAHQGSRLKCFVVISHGVTQWARWQRNTGDPKAGGFDPLAPNGGKEWARGDPGMVKGRPRHSRVGPGGGKF